MAAKDGYPQYRRRNNGVVALTKGVPVDNRSVVPYAYRRMQRKNFPFRLIP